MTLNLDEIKQKAKRYGVRSLARDSDISRNSLIRFLDEGKDLSSTNFLKLLSALNIELNSPLITLPKLHDPNKTDLFMALLELAVETFDPDEVIVFGSQARGDWGPSSDIDFLVAGPKKKLPQLETLDSLAFRKRIDISFDHIVNSTREIAVGAKLPIYKAIKNDGVRVYERRDGR